MKLKPANDRGFLRGEFRDRNDELCSIQKSSVATEDCLWLGADKQRLMHLVSDEGWKELPIPDGAMIYPGRMHLTRKMVKKLIPLLQKFVETGEPE